MPARELRLNRSAPSSRASVVSGIQNRNNKENLRLEEKIGGFERAKTFMYVYTTHNTTPKSSPSA